MYLRLQDSGISNRGMAFDPATILTIVNGVSAIVNAFQKWFGWDEEKAFNELKTKVRSTNWPNYQGIGIKNYKQYSPDDVAAAVQKGSTAVMSLANRIESGNIESNSGRPERRYLKVYGEIVQEMGKWVLAQSQSQPTGPGPVGPVPSRSGSTQQAGKAILPLGILWALFS